MLKKLIIKKRLKKRTEDFINYLESQKPYTLNQEYMKNMLMDNTIEKYLETFKKLLDAGDYVPRKKLEKIRDIIFKNFIKKCKKDNKGYKSFVKLNKKQEKLKKWQDLSGFQTKKNENIMTE